MMAKMMHRQYLPRHQASSAPSETSSDRKMSKRKQKKAKAPVTKGKHKKQRPITPSVTLLASNVMRQPKATTTNASDTNASATNASDENPAIDLTEDESPDLIEPGENAFKKFWLCKPTGKSSQYWEYYLLYHQNHRDKQHLAKCRVVGCSKDLNFKKGLNGLKSHIQFKHPKIWDAIVAVNTPTPKTSSASSSTVSSKLKHQTKLLSHYSPVLTLEEKKQMHLAEYLFGQLTSASPLQW
jgi:hypothetical protein